MFFVFCFVFLCLVQFCVVLFEMGKSKKIHKKKKSNFFSLCVATSECCCWIHEMRFSFAFCVGQVGSDVPVEEDYYIRRLSYQYGDNTCKLG